MDKKARNKLIKDIDKLTQDFERSNAAIDDHLEYGANFNTRGCSANFLLLAIGAISIIYSLFQMLQP